MTITITDLQRWKANSLELASRLGYGREVLNFIKTNCKLKLLGPPYPSELLFGYCYYDSLTIEVYQENVSTRGFEAIRKRLTDFKIPNELIEKIMAVCEQIGEEEFFEIYNQSGMDHEIMGHMYNYLSKKPYDERAAVNTQIDFAKARPGRNWKLILGIMPVVLGYHKGLDELK